LSCTVNGNSASGGGGLANYRNIQDILNGSENFIYSTLTLTDCAVAGNFAHQKPGNTTSGSYFLSSGGGVLTAASTTNMINCTVS
jgi:hypothetical protein